MNAKPSPHDSIFEDTKQNEDSLIGCFVLAPHLLDEYRSKISRYDFYVDTNRWIFEVLESLHDANKRIGVDEIVGELKKRKQFDLIGGAKELARIFQSVTSVHSVAYYASKVRELSERRTINQVASKAMLDALDATLEPEQVIATLQSGLSAIENRTTQEPIGMDRLMPELLTELEERLTGKRIGGRSTGFESIDKILGGLRASELLILAARPSMGKSALAMNIAQRVASTGEPVLFFSLEMSGLELAERLLSSTARVSLHRMRNGTLDSSDRSKLVESSGKLSEAKLLIDDRPSMGMRDIAAAARVTKRKTGLALIVIDYLQLVTPSNLRIPREQQVAEITRSLKMLAKELQVPVLCLAQLNRQAESSSDKKPELSHLRESGAIEQDADVVMFVHRDEYYTKDQDDKGKALLIVKKQRNGRIGDVDLVWHGEFTMFDDPVQEIKYGPFYDFNRGGCESDSVERFV